MRVEAWVKYVGACPQPYKHFQIGLGIYGDSFKNLDNCRPDEWMHMVKESQPTKSRDHNQVHFILDTIAEKGREALIAQMIVYADGKGEAQRVLHKTILVIMSEIIFQICFCFADESEDTSLIIRFWHSFQTNKIDKRHDAFHLFEMKKFFTTFQNQYNIIDLAW